MNGQDSFEKVFQNKNRVLAIFAHPDDAEIYCGGTLARLIKEGKKVRVVKVTSGDRGSRQEKISSLELLQKRESEDFLGLTTLGIKDEDNIALGIGDGLVENSTEVIGMLAKQIRIFKPDIIITHNPEDVVIKYAEGGNYVNHRDHRNTGKSAIDAAYPYSRDLLFFPEHFQEEGVDSHAVGEFLLVDYWEHPDNVCIDVNKYLDIRTKAIACHQSQYTEEQAKKSTEFFTNNQEAKGFEKFRYVVAD